MAKIEEIDCVYVKELENRYPYHIEIDGTKFEVGSEVFDFYIKSINNIGSAGVTVVLGSKKKVEDIGFLQISPPKVLTLAEFVKFVRSQGQELPQNQS